MVKQRSSIVKRRTAIFSRLDALLELLGPAWYDALGSNYGKAALRGPGPLRRPQRADPARPSPVDPVPDPPLPRRLARGPRRRRCWPRPGNRCSCGVPDGIDFAELAADIAVEAEQAQVLTEQIEDLDERIANLYAEADPDGIIASAPGVGPVIAAVIAGRIGDPHRFTSLAAIRAYSGLVPKVSQSGLSDHRRRAHQGRRPAAARGAVRRPPTTPARPTPSSPRSTSG